MSKIFNYVIIYNNIFEDYLELRPNMKMRRLKNTKGTSLVEVMLAVLLIMLLAIGTMSYQVQASRHSRVANAQIKTTRVAEMLLEDW
jgi:Tfp pilus assembly protein PilV